MRRNRCYHPGVKHILWWLLVGIWFLYFCGYLGWTYLEELAEAVYFGQHVRSILALLGAVIVGTLPLTLRYLRRNLLARNPASLEVCSLLVREGAEEDQGLRYVGFRIGDEFVIGYGLDVAERYRNLRRICAYNEDAAKT